ncbi:MAG TPA: DNA mismatch repair endonuclease MutL [Gemmatimonadota bacterium]|nr:DNA mismatch repair endonuclease MutL [Gemmatimonadota bacterium]
MSRVRVLPDGVASQIAAGEVIERPASVVRELIDNALDAGARRIEITLEAAGSERIAVADDGTGMSREDALLAIERHATSKILGIEDLARIATLGFRGEALPSIAAVSRLTLETAPADGEGTRVRVDGGAVTAVEPVARAAGTTADVRRLFHTTPARRKFLKTRATEQASNLQRIVESALARVEVAWRVTHGRREILSLSAARTLPERIIALYGGPYAETFLPIHGSADGVEVVGLIQRPAAAGAGRRRIYAFVNGRPVDAPELLRAVLRGYRSTLPPHARPDVFLFVNADPARVDVNVHPAKREVRFRDPAVVAETVEEAVRAGLGAGPLAAPSRPAPARRVAEPRPPREPRSSRGPDQLGLFFTRSAAPIASPELPEESPGPEGTVVGRIKRASYATGPEGAGFPPLWQLHNRFVLAQTARGMVIIDQHSAHERILYEEVVEDLRAGARPGQRLLFPLVLHLTPEQYATWESYRGMINRLGFEVEPFGGQAIAISSVPAFRHAFDPEPALTGLLDDLSEPGTGSADMNQHERVARLFACKAAIKAGHPLAPDEMSELIDRLFATRLPYDDVHGRPAVLQMDLVDLERQFGRH